MLCDALHVSISSFDDILPIDDVYISLLLFTMDCVFTVYVVALMIMTLLAVHRTRGLTSCLKINNLPKMKV